MVVELLSQWRRDIEAPEAAKLCAALADAGEREPGALDEAEVLGIGGELESRFPDHAPLLVSVGRMYMACGALKRAIKPLALAAKGEESVAAYTLLGELLLRLGDARRSALSFERAIAAGGSEADLGSWLSSAQSYVSLQDEQGAAAVALEIERAIAAELANRMAAPRAMELARGGTVRMERPPRMTVPSLAERATVPETDARVAAWGDDPTQVTPMDRIAAERGEILPREDDKPTAVIDGPAVLALARDIAACKTAGAVDGAPREQPVDDDPTVVRSAPPLPLPAKAAPRTQHAEPMAAAPVRRPPPATPPAPAGHGLPLTRAEPPANTATQTQMVASREAPARRRRGGLVGYLGVVALLAIGAATLAVVTGRVPLPAPLAALGRGAAPADMPQVAADAPASPVETGAPAASSAPDVPAAETAPAETTTAATAAPLPKPPVARRPAAEPTQAPPAEKPKPPEKAAPVDPAPTATAQPATPIWAGDPELRR